MPSNQRSKAAQGVNTVQTVQTSLGIQGPKNLPGRGTGRQTLPESLGLGRVGKRTATKIGRNHVRDSMGL